MFKRKREFWDYFENVEGGLKCRFCQVVFSEHTSSAKIKAHLSGVAELVDIHSDNICGKAPNDVKAAAFEAIQSVNKRIKTMPGSSANESRNVVPTSSQRQTDENEIGEMATSMSMRGVVDVSEQSDALDSHGCLRDLTNQECFLYSALFPKDFKIPREELIEYLIVERIIKDKKRHLEHDKGHVILNELERACLLKDCLLEHGKYCTFVKMDGSARDVATKKLIDRSLIMVKAGAQLRTIPNMDEWTDSLVRVSLMENYIREIPSGHSPKCPKLSTLLLRSNEELWLIADSFFKHLQGLKVLDLSNTRIVKLPNSISQLENLVALLINCCVNLKYIPSLAKLTKLQKLDLSETGLQNLPEGMKSLSNLRYLNLRGSKVREITTEILPNFSYLQILIVNNFWGSKARISVPRKEEIIQVIGNEVAGLKKLESLECYFEDFSDFSECMKDLSLCTFIIQIGPSARGNKLSKSKRRVYLCGCIIRAQDFKAFPKRIEELLMENCKFPRIALFDDSSLRCLAKLESIYLHKCCGIKSLVSLPYCFKSLKTLRLSELKKFRAVISGPLQFIDPFSCLKHLEINDCNRVKRLFPINLLSTLQSLEILTVKFCARMEEIQATEKEEEEEEEEEEDEDEDEEEDDEEDEEEDDDEDEEEQRRNNLSVALPKLRKLELIRLPKLKAIFSGVIHCESLKDIQIVKCTKLKRIPLAYPLPSVQRIEVYPKEWWETVKWDQCHDKNLLQGFLKFALME